MLLQNACMLEQQKRCPASLDTKPEAGGEERQWQGSLPSRPKQCRIKNVWPVSACQNHYALLSGKAVHLYQQLVQGVFPLVISPGKTTTSTSSANGINLICKGTQTLDEACPWEQGYWNLCLESGRKVHILSPFA